MTKVLLVEDDPTLAKVTSLFLDDYQVDVAETGNFALACLRLQEYDLIVLDWMLPDITGLEVCQKYRASGGRAPILMLTARDNKHDKAQALDGGADDYFVKPIEEVEFQARVRALLRRPGSFAGQILKVKDVEINTLKQAVTRAGKPIDLRAKEYSLLEFLMRHAGQSFTAEILLQRLWESESASSQDTVRMHIMALRKKLEDSDEQPLIVSVRGRGYKFADH